MYKDKKILAVIPARGGSKGIKNKNIKLLNGKPLIAYSIKTALSCPLVDYVLVSTDSQKIADIAKSYGAKVPFLRPAELATDTAKTIDVLIHAVDYLKKQNLTFDYLILLQPTQPIRQDKDLLETIKTVVDSKINSLVSVCEVEESPVLMRTMATDGKLSKLLTISSTLRRQDFPKFYKVNGSIYINKLDKSFNSLTSLNDNEFGYIMPKEKSIDIDTESDFQKAELYFTNKLATKGEM